MFAGSTRPWDVCNVSSGVQRSFKTTSWYHDRHKGNGNHGCVDLDQTSFNYLPDERKLSHVANVILEAKVSRACASVDLILGLNPNFEVTIRCLELEFVYNSFRNWFSHEKDAEFGLKVAKHSKTANSAHEKKTDTRDRCYRLRLEHAQHFLSKYAEINECLDPSRQSGTDDKCVMYLPADMTKRDFLKMYSQETTPP